MCLVGDAQMERIKGGFSEFGWWLKWRSFRRIKRKCSDQKFFPAKGTSVIGLTGSERIWHRQYDYNHSETNR